MFSANLSGLYSEYELEQNAVKAQLMYGIGLAGYENFTFEAQRSTRRLESYFKKLLREIPEIEKDLRPTVSAAMEHTKANLDTMLQNQAAAMASLSGGPVGLMMQQINNKSTEMYNDQMNKGRMARIDEIQRQNQTYYNVLHGRLGLANQAHGQLTQLLVAQGAQDTQMAQVGMQSSIDVARLLTQLRLGASEQEINRSKLRYDWAANLLNAETSLYGHQMNYMANTFGAMATFEASRYNTDINAQASIFRATSEANRSMFQSAMSGLVGIYQPNVASSDTRYQAGLSVGLGLKRLETSKQINAAVAMADIIAGSVGKPESIISAAIQKYGNFLDSSHFKDDGGGVDKLIETLVSGANFTQEDEE